MDFEARRYGSEKTGVITGFLFEPGEPGRSVDADEACDAIGRGGAGFGWLHFNLANQASLR